VRIDAVETVVSPNQPNVCVVRLHAGGLTGLGETFYGAGAVESYVHQEAAPALFELGAAATPELAAVRLATYVGYQGSGAETRGNSAIDIALWDLTARRAGLPLNVLLGGPVRDRIGVYNTCAGPSYVRGAARQNSANWGLGPARRYEDLAGFLHRPGELARELLDAGFTGLKVWPFDLAAESAHGGPGADLRPGLRILDAIRDEVGDGLDLYVELHGLWNLPGARRLLGAIADHRPLWVEDPIRADHTEALVALAGSTRVPIAAGETIAGQHGFHPLLARGALDFAIVDLTWTGGITEGRRIASLAALHGVPVAPHDCTGPIGLAAGLHFVTSIPNGFVQEVARAFYHGWYGAYVVGLPELGGGSIRVGDRPGLGLDLRPELLAAPDTRIVRSVR
jgi:L-alanine-DL-glutamate epimerase-like enolase superfamily enzyme